MKKIFILFVFVLSIQFGTAQLPNFKKFSYTEGLKTYNIKKTLEDRYGFIWIATQDGLYRYDGNEFESVKHTPFDLNSIDGNFIFDICYDGNNKLYLTSFLNGIDVIDVRTLNTSHFFCSVNKNVGRLKNGWIKKMELYDNQLWIFCESYFAKIDINTKEIFYPLKQQFPEVKEAAFVKIVNENIAIGCNGMGLTTSENKRLINAKNNLRLTKTDYKSQLFFKDLIIKKDNCYLILEDIIVRGYFNRGTWIPQEDIFKPTQKQGIINSAVIDSENNMWVGTNNGLYKIPLSENKIENKNGTQVKLLDESINNLQIDSKNNLWISSSKELNSLPLKESSIKSFKGQKNAVMSHLYSIIPKDSINIYTTGTNGLFETNINTGITQKIKGSGEVGIVHYATYINGNELLVSTDKGMYLYNEKNNSFSQDAVINKFSEWKPFIKNYFNNSIVTDNKEYWVSENNEGLFIWNKKSKIIIQRKAYEDEKNGLVENHFHNIKKDNQGYAWLLGDSSVVQYNLKNDSVLAAYKFKNTGNFLGSKYIFDMYDDGENLWFCSYEGGLCILNKKTKIWKNITESEGLSNNATYSILKENDTMVWVSSNNGLNRININTRKIDNIFSEDGLHSNSFEEKGGLLFNKKLYFSGIDGFSEINLQKFRSEKNIKNLLIKSIEIISDNKSNKITVIDTNYIHAPSNTQSIIIKLATNDFYNVEKLKIYYRIKNKQSIFLEIPKTMIVQLSGLEYGKYEIEFKYANELSVEKFKTIKITILPKWHQTILFKILVALTIIGILWLLYSFRINQLKKIINVRKKISSDLHDDIGSTLSSINMYSQIAQLQPNDHSHAASIQENTRGVLEKLDDIVWAINPKNDKLSNLTERMDSFARPLLQAKGIEFNFEPDVKMQSSSLEENTRQNLFLIYKEAINNICKYAQCKTCTVTLFTKSKQLFCTITDDGIGFDTTLPSERNGLLNMKQRVTQLKGKINISSAVGEGTSINIQLPL